MQREFLVLLVISALATALPQVAVKYEKKNSTLNPPRFKNPSRMYNMEMKPAGSSVRLKCPAVGNPMPNITWLKNNGPVERTFFPPIYGKWSMAFEELTKNDNGNYTCVVCNELGCINHTVNLVVPERFYTKPILTKDLGNLTVLVGETATFRCEFQSDLHPFIYWNFFKTHEEYEMSENNGFSNQAAILTSHVENDKPEVLTISNVTQEQQGWYVCTAVNTLGASSGKGYLTVLTSPNHDKVSNYLIPIVDILFNINVKNFNVTSNGSVANTKPTIKDWSTYSNTTLN